MEKRNPKLKPCNKLHGYAYLGSYVDSRLIPCIKAKLFQDDTLIDSSFKYSIKKLKDYPEKCKTCKLSCEDCLEGFTYDMGLPIKINANVFDMEDFISSEKDEDSSFYYYKYFHADKFGRLIINRNGFAIEIIDNNDSGKVIESYRESFAVEPNVDELLNLSEKELSDIRFYTFRLTDYLSLFLKCDRSFLFEFVFTEKEHHYFEHKEFSDTDLLLYGMRSYSYIREIDFESDSFLTM